MSRPVRRSTCLSSSSRRGRLARRDLTAIVLAASAAALSAGSFAGAETIITVDLALDDFTDFGGAQTVADLPGPDGHITLREAVTAANNTPGPQTIAFAIPPSEWSFWFTDRAIIRLDFMCYVSDDETTIDFATQTAFSGDTNPNGNEVGLDYAGVPSYIPCLWIAANNCTVRGLDVAFGNNFSQTMWITGNGNRVVGCTTNGLTIRGDYGGGDFNTIGGTEPGEGNTFSEGVNLTSAASDNVLIGNEFHWGLSIIGDTFYGTCDRNRVGGPLAAERNTLSGHGYYAEEGLPSGTQLDVAHAHDTIVEGNFVGTTNDGMAKYPGKSGAGGIAISIAAIDTIVRNNLVAGIEMTGIDHYNGERFGVAIGVGASASGTTLIGNRIGVAADGTTPLLNVQGILVQANPNGTPQMTTIGGTGPNEGNLIAHNETTGVVVTYGASGVTITANSIFDNGGLGIDLLGLGPAGMTANDPGDGDVGGNGLQNFPVVTSAESDGGQVAISGTLNSTPSSAFTIELFASDNCAPGGFGQGKTYLGSIALTTDAGGNGAFSTTLPAAALLDGSVITATATATATGNTSEFSACRQLVAVTPSLGDLDRDGLVNASDLAILLGSWGSCSGCAADLDGDGTVSAADLGVLLGAWSI